MGDQVVRMVVDADTCIAAGQCEMLEPGTFLVDDDTLISTVVGSGTLPPDRAARIVDRCPAGAISIQEPSQK
jgi:ferredoxin